MIWNPDSWTRVVRTVGVDPIDKTLLQQLRTGDIAVLVLRGILDEEQSKAYSYQAFRLYDQAETAYYTNGHLTTIGPYLAKHLSNPANYFDESDTMNDLVAEAGFDVADVVRSAFVEQFSLDGIDVAQEPNGRRYAGTVVRIHPDGVTNPMHNDMIVRDAADHGLVVSDLSCQLSCVICLQECATGGELKIYGKSWEPDDERFKIPGGLGYEYGVVEGCAAHEFKPDTGDVYIINPTHYHEILRVGGDDRLTVGFFIGFGDEDMTSAIAWG